MSPRRVGIQTRASISQTSRQIQIFVPKLEQGIGLVSIEEGHLPELFSCGLILLLAQVGQRQGLMSIAVGWIELQGMLEEWNRFLRRAQFEVIHSNDDVEG